MSTDVTDQPEQPADRPTEAPRPPSVDPFRGFRGVMAATLILEAIVVLLTLLVVSKFGSDNGGPLGVTLVVLLAVAMVVACRFVGKPWAIRLAVTLQVLLLASAVLVFALGVLGVLFGLVWSVLLWMRRDVARKMAAGELPSQQGW